MGKWYPISDQHKKDVTIMKKWIAFTLTALLLAGCAKRTQAPATAPTQTAPAATVQETTAATQAAAPAVTGAEALTGPWYLDTQKNDMGQLRLLFGSSLASGTSMEIRSNGNISYSIGAGTGGAGTYTYDGKVLTADITGFAENTAETTLFTLVTEDGKVWLTQEVYGLTVYWTQEEPVVEVDRDLAEYAQILDLYNKALAEHWDRQACGDNGVNYLVSGLDADSVGWVLQDVDGDGVKELLIGSLGAPNIYALYTVTDGAPKLVAEAFERSAWYLEPDGILVNEGHNSAFQMGYQFFWLRNGGLVLNNALIADYHANENAPWYLAKDEDWDVKNDTKVSTEQAESWIRAYQQNFVEPDYAPFSQYAAG